MSLFSIVSKDGTEPLDAIYSGGEWRLLSSRPTPDKTRALFTPFASSNPIIPRSQWIEVSRPRLEVPVLDQGQRGSCVGHGSATAMMLSRSIAGQSFRLLSAPFIYSQINGGVDDGSIPGDAATVLLTKGVCLMSEFPEPEYLASRVPASAYKTAERFKALEIYRCMGFDDTVSAFLLGFSVFHTVMVGNNFNNLDSNGVPPITRGPGNHCIAFGSTLKRTKNGVWLMEDINSWTAGWGIQGRYFHAEQHCIAQGSSYEAWAIKSVADDPQDPNSLPAAA